MKLRVAFTRRSNIGADNFNFITKAPKTNRLGESVILNEGIFESVADAFRLGNLGDKLSKYAENNRSILKSKIKDLEEKLKQDGVNVKAIKAYENMRVKDVMNRREDGTFSAIIQNILDNCNNNTEHPIARKTVCYIIMFSLLTLFSILMGSTSYLNASPVAIKIIRIILTVIGVNLNIKVIDGCLKQNGATIVGTTLTATLLGAFMLAVKSTAGGALHAAAIGGVGASFCMAVWAALYVWLVRRQHKQKYGEDVASSKEKAKVCSILYTFALPLTWIHLFISFIKKFSNINKYKSFDSEKIDEAEFYNNLAAVYGRRTIREAKSYNVGSAKRKARSKRSLRGWM